MPAAGLITAATQLRAAPAGGARCPAAAADPRPARRRAAAGRTRAQSGGGGGAPPPPPPPGGEEPARAPKPDAAADAAGFSLDDINPISMGRRSREVFDDVWSQLQRLGAPGRGAAAAGWVPADAPAEFESPRAAETTVLVAGATGRVGRVLVRKLLLRGYRVRALVRVRPGQDGAAAAAGGGAGADGAGVRGIPRSVEVVPGDVGDPAACAAAVRGADKVIWCAAARSTLAADLLRVEERGPAALARALMDARNAAARRARGGAPAPGAKVDVADFADAAYHARWDVVHCGPPGAGAAAAGGDAAPRRARLARARDRAEAYINEDDRLVFEGAVYSRGGYAEVGAPLAPLPHGGGLAGTEGLLLRLKGDAHAYALTVGAGEGGAARSYYARFATRAGFSSVRLPWSTFVGAGADCPPLDPAAVTDVRIRFEPRARDVDAAAAAAAAAAPAAGAAGAAAAAAAAAPAAALDLEGTANRFCLEVDWIKALPGGEETDFVMVSCAGAALGGADAAQRERVLAAKRRGEAALRNSGLGYTVVRPGALREEAGGYRALVFDQGNRIAGGVACADVADVCLKALHDPAARNKTFEVCWEARAEAEAYELVAHLPDKSNNYLSPALAGLQKNT